MNEKKTLNFSFKQNFKWAPKCGTNKPNQEFFWFLICETIIPEFNKIEKFSCYFCIEIIWLILRHNLNSTFEQANVLTTTKLSEFFWISKRNRTLDIHKCAYIFNTTCVDAMLLFFRLLLDFQSCCCCCCYSFFSV